MTYVEIMARCENEPIFFLGLCSFVTMVFAFHFAAGYAICEAIFGSLHRLFSFLKVHFQKPPKRT